MMWYTIRGNEIEIRIFAKPNAKRSDITGVHGEELGVVLHARPVEGEANKALLSFLSKKFKLPVSKIMLKRGLQSRHKTVVMPLLDSIMCFIREIEET